MEKSVQITLIIVLGVVVLFGMLYSSFFSLMPETNTVTGNGESSIDVVPDLVTVYFNVETKADTSKEATDENAKIVDDLITNIIREGFSREDIQTQDFNIYPDYTWVNGQRRENGYRATHRIRLEMSTERTDKIGDVIDAGIEAGAGISYINFELSQEKQNEYKTEAIKLAAEDARIKAQALAQGLDKNLGKLVSVSNSDFRYSPWLAYASSSGTVEDAELAKEATTDIQPSKQEITARVTAVYKLR